MTRWSAPDVVRQHRRHNLLLTLVMVGVGMTPAWLGPSWLVLPWMVAGVLFGGPAVYYTWRYAPWMPSPAVEVPRIVTALGLGPGQGFCDLGAGDGRLVVAVRRATGARCVGIEAAPLQYLVGRLHLALRGDRDTVLRFGDLHRADLSGFDALYVWGTAYWVATPAFREHLQRTLKPGARVVSYHHRLHGLRPVRVDDSGVRPIYVFVPRP